MIQKIQSNEYLKRIGNMTAVEKEAYLNRAGEWLEKQAPLLLSRVNDSEAVFQNAMQCSAGWNDAECQAWTEGAQLLTALVAGGDTWLPDMLYTKAAKRAIRNMVRQLKLQTQDEGLPRHPDMPTSRHADKDKAAQQAKQGPAGKQAATFRGFDKQDHDGEGEEQANLNAEGVASEQRERSGKPETCNLKPVAPARPRHIDQYVHLLPAKTQEKAATVRGLLRDLDVARENARKLMNANAQGDKIAQWARTATKLDEKVKAIYKELDAEWEKLIASGRVTVDDFGNAHVTLATKGASTERSSEQSTDTKNTTADDAELSKETKAKIKSLRSWLRDTRGPKEAGEKHDAYMEKWKAKYQEMTALGGKDTVTEAVIKAAALYGINLDELPSNGNTTDETTRPHPFPPEGREYKTTK